MHQSRRKIEFIDTKEKNKTVRVDSMFIHSKYYPQSEAVTFLDNNRKIYEGKNEVVVYGIGLGYHINELLKRIKFDTKVYIFDVDFELFEITKSYELIIKILEDKRVKFYCGYSKEILYEFSQKINKVNDILIFKPAFKCIPEKYNEFKNIINGYELGKTGIKKNELLMNENEKFNENLKCNSIDKFFDKFNFNGETVIIVSAGPSLDENLEKLKSVSKKNVKIFVVGSALKALLNNEIKPDMVCIIDPNEIIYNQIKGCEELDIPLCFLSTASNLTISNYKGPKYIFYNDLRNNNIVINTGKSVATAILSIAIKGNANKIIFLGQDLAYIGNKSHCDLYPYNSGIPGNGGFKQVESVDGKMLQTTDVLLYFKHWIEKTIKQNTHIRFINCSNGARIEGTENCDLLEAYK